MFDWVDKGRMLSLVEEPRAKDYDLQKEMGGGGFTETKRSFVTERVMYLFLISVPEVVVQSCTNKRSISGCQRVQGI